jgi:hypothetical protein
VDLAVKNILTPATRHGLTAILAKLLRQKQGIDRPNRRSLTLAQHARQFLAAVSADREEAPDYIPPE